MFTSPQRIIPNAFVWEEPYISVELITFNNSCNIKTELIIFFSTLKFKSLIFHEIFWKMQEFWASAILNKLLPKKAFAIDK